MLFAWFTQLDYRELTENGSGLGEIILLTLLLFIIMLPVFVVRAWLRRKALKTAVSDARDWAAKVAIGIFFALPLLAGALLVPFGIFNMMGSMIFHQELYWPLIVPGLIVTYGLGATGIYWVIRDHRRREKARATEKRSQ